MRISARIEPYKRWMLLAGLLLLYILLVRLAGRYNNYPYGDWHSEIYADKAGYYIYLPAAFLHGFYQTGYPEDIEERFGHGFRFENGKLFDKYPMGVAVLISPFFLLAHIMAISGKGPADGFSGDYYEMTYYASVFYFLAGGIFLHYLLKRRYSKWISLLTVSVVMFGTNIFYYAFRDPLMSHVYSFALFSLLLLLTDNLWKSRSPGRLYLVALVAALMLLVRPSNVVFLPVIILLGSDSASELKTRLKFIFRPQYLAISAFIFLLVLLPQMIYWKFLSGNFLFNTYKGEGFNNWDSPMFAEVLFSPANGLLTYTPAYFLVILGFIGQAVRKEKDRWLGPALFILLLYIFSSWYDYRFGCGFGQRSYVEYLALFAIPLASLFNWAFHARLRIQAIVVSGLILYVVYLNIGLAGIYYKCHFGGDWEWPAYRVYYEKAGLFPFLEPKGQYSWIDGFEERQPVYSSRTNVIQYSGAFSGNRVSRADTTIKYTDGFSAELDHIITGNLSRIDVNFQCYFSGPPGKAMVVCSVSKGDEMVYYQVHRFDQEPGLKQNEWNEVSTSFVMDGLDAFGFIKVYVWLAEGQEIYTDDLKISVVRKKK